MRERARPRWRGFPGRDTVRLGYVPTRWPRAPRGRRQPTIARPRDCRLAPFARLQLRMTSPDSARPSSSNPCRLKEMRPAQVRELLARDQRLIVPIGTCEQHGPHMPLGSDTIIVERLADDLSAE